MISLNAWLAPSAIAEVDVISCGSVTFDTCSVNMLCFDNGYHKVTRCVNKPATWYRQNAKKKVFHKELTRKELIVWGLIKDPNEKKATYRDSGNNGGSNGNGTNANGSDAGRDSVTTRTDRNCVVTKTCSTETYAYRPSSRATDPQSILREACPKLERLAEEKGATLKSNGKDLKKSEAAEDLSECVVSRARLPNPDTYGEKSLACLELMAQSCFEELDRLNAEQNPDCVDCNMR